VIQFLKKLLGLPAVAPKEKVQSPLENASVPGWRTEVLVHPNYWIELNFTLVEKLPPFLKNSVDYGLHNGRIKDINREVAKDAIALLCETLVIQLRTHVGEKEGAWKVQHQDDVLSANIRVQEDKAWARVVTAWEITQKIVLDYGMQLKDSEEEWDRSSLTGSIKVPTGQFRLNVDSPLMWTVLHRSRKFPILWKDKLWVPK